MPIFWYPITEGTRHGTKKRGRRDNRPGHLGEQIIYTDIGFVYCYVKAHGKRVGPNCKMNPVSPQLHPYSYYCHFHVVVDGQEYKAHALKDRYGDGVPLAIPAVQFSKRVRAHLEGKESCRPCWMLIWSRKTLH